MKLNNDQINRLQRALDLTRQAQNEISSANLGSATVETSGSSEITSGLSTIVASIKNVLEQNGQKPAEISTGAGR
ncbi:MAG: hypothetical protein ABSB35_20490 [Bryobacteraceae bacterium]|jgi:hypothetical protein